MPIVRQGRLVATLAAAVLALGVLAGCEEQGPAEEAGEAIDETVEGAGDAIDDATD